MTAVVTSKRNPGKPEQKENQWQASFHLLTILRGRAANATPVHGPVHSPIS